MHVRFPLPAVRDLARQDYACIRQTDSLPRFLRLLEARRELGERSPVFLEGGTLLYALPYGQVRSSHQPDQLAWRRAAQLNGQASLRAALEELRNTEYVLVMDGPDPIGYLSAPLLANALYEEYAYLEVFFETAIKTSDVSLSAVNENGQTVIWSAGSERLFSIKAEDILGQPMSAYFPDEMIQVLKTLKTGETVYRQLHQPEPDRYVIINVNPVRHNGRIIGAAASEVDITGQVRLNRELFEKSSKVQQLEQDITRLSMRKDPFLPIKGTSGEIKQVIETIRKLKKTHATVFILGESGVGKELFARAIHDLREQPQAPFIAINCAAIPTALFESELFGYEKGAFSGADQRGRKGKIELARGGTLFLDEIGEMPLDMQAKLLRVLEERKYYPVGGNQLIEADCRIVAATNRDPLALVKEGKFREDLYYRLNVITLDIPPLRKRKEDIPELVFTFINEFSVRYNRYIEELSPDVMEALMQYEWPVNVRELRNTIERLVVLSTDGYVKWNDLPASIQASAATALPLRRDQPPFFGGEVHSLADERQVTEKEVILKALAMENGNRKAAAERLGISRATLYNKINKYGIDLTKLK
jgi:PAS domain S-box-containing protein